jgi:hypothetical protein
VPQVIRTLVVLLGAGFAAAQAPQPDVQPSALKAEDIMARVGANQARSEELRNQYVYTQHVHIATHKPNSRMIREENADYDVVAQPSGIEKHLKALTGRYWKKDKYVDFKGDLRPDSAYANPNLVHDLASFDPDPLSRKTDEDLIHYLRSYLLDDQSKDGVARALFPLTFDQQKNYEFKLLGQETEGGRNVYHIAFWPKDKTQLTWAGEASIDATEFQPVRVFTKMSRPIPFLVRTLWFDLPGLGFDVSYQRQEDGVWFPWVFGTEFRMHAGAVFYVNRDVAISMENSGFARTRVEAK